MSELIQADPNSKICIEGPDGKNIYLEKQQVLDALLKSNSRQIKFK